MWMIVDRQAGPARCGAVEKAADGRLAHRSVTPEPSANQWAALRGADGIVHVLPHGGEVVRESAQGVDTDVLGRIASTKGFLPEESRKVLDGVGRALESAPGIPQVLLCDTAFFTALPDEAALYAVPYRFSSKGIRRYGGDGLAHEWAWRRIAEPRAGGAWSRTAARPVHRVVSLRLGNRCNVAAIRDGKPVDTSIGFTPAEGLPTDVASGDVDPTLVFELHSQGYSLEEIYELLCRGSGFSGYCGRPTGFLDMLRRNDPVTTEVRGIFFASLAKYLGAMLASLDGADVLAIGADAGWEALDGAMETCRRLSFLGVKARAPERREGNEPTVLTEEGSSITVVFLPAPRWMILFEHAQVHR